jgi:hypothetical protein
MGILTTNTSKNAKIAKYGRAVLSRDFYFWDLFIAQLSTFKIISIGGLNLQHKFQHVYLHVK